MVTDSIILYIKVWKVDQTGIILSNSNKTSWLPLLVYCIVAKEYHPLHIYVLKDNIPGYITG